MGKDIYTRSILFQILVLFCALHVYAKEPVVISKNGTLSKSDKMANINGILGFSLGIDLVEFQKLKPCDGVFANNVFTCKKYLVLGEPVEAQFSFIDSKLSAVKMIPILDDLKLQSKVKPFLGRIANSTVDFKDGSQVIAQEYYGAETTLAKKKFELVVFNSSWRKIPDSPGDTIETEKSVDSFQAEIKKVGGDKLKIYSACPHVRKWLPNTGTIGEATEWHIVPPYVSSKTYGPQKPKGGGFQLLDAEIVDESGRSFSKDECDYVRIVFQGSKISSIDRSKCEKRTLESSSDKACKQLLGY